MYITEGHDVVGKNDTRITKTPGKPILVSQDRLSGAVFGHRVQCKGSSATWAVKKVIEDLKDCGYGGSKICIRSDQENAIKDLMAKVIETREGVTIP